MWVEAVASGPPPPTRDASARWGETEPGWLYSQTRVGFESYVLTAGESKER